MNDELKAVLNSSFRIHQTERLSYYFHAQLAEQFDAVFHFDETTTVEPLEREPH